MLDNEFDYERVLDNDADLIKLFRELQETNIAFAFRGPKERGHDYPFMVHVVRNRGRATVREMDYVLVPE